MKIVLLDGEKIHSVDDLHNAFAEALALPEWYGRNLDALHDVLTDAAEEIGVIAVNTDGLEKHLGRRWKPFLRLMEETGREQTAVRFCFDPFGERE